MKSSFRNGTVRIDITTYEKEDTYISHKMERQHNCPNNQNPKFICSICLNTKSNNEEQDDKRTPRSCQICKQVYEFKVNTNERRKDKVDTKNVDDLITKKIQTSRPDVSQGLNLLNEVLTVFQTKKQQDFQKERSKTVLVKDASVSTDDQAINVLKPKLTLSKIFRLSIEENNTNSSGKFSIVSSSEPKHSHPATELIKHKSSSIPQMKLEELKHALKEKVKPKDAIEEVNRMFATFKRDNKRDSNNRPKVRNGPRVLPVVKTENYVPTTPKSGENESLRNETKPQCKCCDTNYYLSSGDSLAKQECHKSNDKGDKSVYMMCCRYKKKDLQTNFVICERCKMGQNGRYEADCPCFL